MENKDGPPQGPGPPTTGTAAANAKDHPAQNANVALASDAEQSRRLAEEQRQLRERDREASEANRQTKEQLRDAAESARAAAEEARLAAEDARHAVVDSVRTTSETLRITLKQMTKIEEMRRSLLRLRDADNPESK
jgi:colicin import membrane protein